MSFFPSAERKTLVISASVHYILASSLLHAAADLLTMNFQRTFQTAAPSPEFLRHRFAPTKFQTAPGISFYSAAFLRALP